MARIFGVVSTASGISAVVIHGITSTQKADIAEAKGADGRVTDRKVVSVTKTVEVKGLIDGTMTVAAGDKITAGSITDGLITDITITEVNNEYQAFTCTVEQKDSATNVAYTVTV